MSIALSQPTNMTLLRSLVSCFYSLLTLGIAGARNANQFSSLPRKKPVTRFKSSLFMAPSAPFRCAQLFTFHSSLFTLHSSLFTLHSSLFTLHSSLFTLHSSLFILHSSLFTLHSSLFTLHSSLFTLHSSLFTLHGAFCAISLRSTFHSSLFILHSPLKNLVTPSFFLSHRNIFQREHWRLF